MNKLTEFYLNLTTDAKKIALFNQGNTEELINNNRLQMLTEAGVDNAEQIIKMKQAELRQHIAKQLKEEAPEWGNLSDSSGNTHNSDNNASIIGNRAIH